MQERGLQKLYSGSRPVIGRCQSPPLTFVLVKVLDNAAQSSDGSWSGVKLVSREIALSSP